jgi:(p)ppGpp synthase/HD superfamily hydrolase
VLTLNDTCQNGPVAQQIEAILFAAHYAADKHRNQKRKGENAEPYVNHLIEVAYLVSTVAPDTSLVIAALLHDSIEDVGVTKEELSDHFGSVVADLVAEVTDDKSLPKQERKRLQIEHAPRKSAGAQNIKLADKISNLRALVSSPPVDWSLQRRQEYVAWARRVVDGFAAPNPALKAEFEKTLKRFDEVVGQSDLS